METVEIIVVAISFGAIVGCIIYIAGAVINTENVITHPTHAYLIEWTTPFAEINGCAKTHWEVVYFTPSELEDYIKTFEYNRILSITKLD